MTIKYDYKVRMSVNLAEINEASVVFSSAIVRSTYGDMFGHKPLSSTLIEGRLINDIDDQILLAAKEIAAKRSKMEKIGYEYK